MRWLCIYNPPEVKPLDDLYEHTDGALCWCSPFDDEGVLIHNSADKREYVERGEALLH